jgi:hypothetical protein
VISVGEIVPLRCECFLNGSLLLKYPLLVRPIRPHWLEDGAVVHAARHVRPSAICRHDAKAHLQCVRQTRNPLRTTRVLAHYHRILPIFDIQFDPFDNQWLSAKVVDGTLEEALHLRGMEVDRYYVVHASNSHEVGDHSRGDGASMGLLLGLARVWEVGHDGYSVVSQCI